MINWKHAGWVINQERTRNGLSLRDVQESVGISATTLHRLEKGTCRKWGKFLRVYRYWGLTWDDLHRDLTEDPKQLRLPMDWR